MWYIINYKPLSSKKPVRLQYYYYYIIYYYIILKQLYDKSLTQHATMQKESSLLQLFMRPAEGDVVPHDGLHHDGWLVEEKL